MSKVAFRVDASLQIGTGHVMRCMTLAEMLKQRGAHIRFISRHMPEHLQQQLQSNGYELHMLPLEESADQSRLAHAAWLGTTQKIDVQASVEVLSDTHWDWLVVDHYALDAEWESRLREVAGKILAIDDLADRQHDCDMLLDQNYYADMHSRYSGKVPEYCRLLLGPRYALLREEFRDSRKELRSCREHVERILVCFGGMDAANYTSKAIAALAPIISKVHVDVVIGAKHPAREFIRAECLRLGFECHVQTTQMAQLMAQADLAIGAGGITTWERCCLGLPSITIAVAENQKAQLRDAAVAGLLYMPDANEEGSLVGMDHHLLSLLGNFSLRSLIFRNGLDAVDGKGTLRTVTRMGFVGLQLRAAVREDMHKMFDWRNHPSIRSVSRNGEPLVKESHKRWFDSVMADDKKHLLIAESNLDEIGVVRFDMVHDEAEISIYLVPDSDNSGRGSELLRAAELWLAEHFPNVSILRAEVLGANDRSHHLFQSNGYLIETTAYVKRLHCNHA